jgi:cytidylate kinase
MDSTFLAKYLDARFTGELLEPAAEHKGMVITISRDTGCDGEPIVKEFIRQLNANLKGISKKHPWQFISKEIFAKSAKKLNVKLDIFDEIETTKDKSFVEDIIHSFSTEKYPSDFKIKKTFREVIESVEKGGGVVVLGRAGVAIVKHSRRNLHVKLTAPVGWRIQKIAKEYGISEAKAAKHINESDKKRGELKKYYMRRKVLYSDYDVVLNVSTLTKKEITLALVSLVEEKGKKRK